MKKPLLLLIIPLLSFGQDYFYPPEKMNLSLQERFGSVFNNPEFYPIGWSDDGLFAYKMIYCDGGCGCCSNSIIIQSAKSDKIIDHFMLPSDEDEFEGTEEDKWRESTRNINAFLNKYNIENTGLGKLYTSKRVNDFNIILRTNSIQYNTDENCYHLENDVVTTYNIQVGNKDLGYKTITKKEAECIYESDINYVGYFKSPFENRIIVVIAEEHQGFEAETEYDLYFYGCGLKPQSF